MMGNFMGRGNQHMKLVKVLYYKLLTISEQLSIFPHKVWGLNLRPQRLEASVLLLCYCGPICLCQDITHKIKDAG